MDDETSDQCRKKIISAVKFVIHTTMIDGRSSASVKMCEDELLLKHSFRLTVA